ncbi:hypothetical protein [Burkholderia vietnamiensis]|uniref:hypothetical protein n=2 Tax=Burkholderia vietnamiensis TaxID=60552 RepID=UPI001CB523D9|nr:hypothetical protein [Burkholderia vietnamiensis]MDN7925906.1 hypothetical protein [Burkholderia vietnamiensis]CAG9195691.1 conserved hypothetical protein [Burkholderia vietnamiensis]
MSEMTTTATLDDSGHFHDWYLDIVAIGPNEEPRTLTLGLYLGNRRATVTFEGVTCFQLDRLGLLNIVYSLRLMNPADHDYARVSAQLAKGERLSGRRGANIAYLYSSLGAELAVEFDALKIGSNGA